MDSSKRHHFLTTIAAFASGLIALTIAACGGGAGSLPGVSVPAPTKKIAAAIVITIPTPPGIAPRYISASTTSMSVKINGGAASSYPLTPGSPGCIGNPLTCTVAISAPIGNDTFAITLYNASNQALSTNSVSADIVSGQANSVNITFNGVIASIALSITGNAVVGTPATLPIILVAKDAGGNTIVGPGVFTTAILLGDSDGSGHTHLQANGINEGLSYSVADSTKESGLSLVYDGAAMSAISITAAAGAIHAVPVPFQPSPQPSPTPTPLPTARPLPGPLMQDTFNSIGLVQIFDGNITPSQDTADAHLYDFIWGSSRPKSWLAGNSLLVTTYYAPWDTDFDVTGFGALGHDITWWNASAHPDWVLYKCDRKTLARVGGLPINVPLDMSNPAVVAYQMQTVAPYMAQAGYNSLGVDVFSLQNGQAGCGVWTQNHTVWVAKFSGQPADPAWAAAAEYWAAYAQWYLHSLTPQASLVANVSLNGAKPGDPAMQQLISHLDGDMDEAGFTGFGGHLVDDSLFRSKVGWMQYIQAQGKASLISDEWKGAEPTPPQRDFAISTYLMGRYHQAVLWTAEYGKYGAERWHSDFAAAIGSPCADMVSTQGVYLRKNTTSLVIVNPGVTAVNVTLPKAASNYTDIEGRAVTDPLLVTPDDGWVLLTANGCQ